MLRKLLFGVFAIQLAACSAEQALEPGREIDDDDEAAGQIETEYYGQFKDRGGTNGDYNYCTGTIQCVGGEGDCDPGECAPGFVCAKDNGPNFGSPPNWDYCVPVHCTDRLQNADETGVDCGGADCGVCVHAVCAAIPAGAYNKCTAACPCSNVGDGDCDGDISCLNGMRCKPNIGAFFGTFANFDMCVAAHCMNHRMDADETGRDCGGAGCQACVSATCSDGIQNQGETGIDCGGPCAACSTCSDSMQNGDETGVDCGGSCPACPTCSDGIQNQGETGTDCGGPCPACTSCSDGIQNGSETGIDCGGSCAACPPLVPIIETEPNGTTGTADPMTSDGTQVSGNIRPAGDHDYFSFSGTAGDRVWIEGDTGGPQIAGANSRDTVMDLYDTNGTTVLENDDDDGSGNGGDGTLETGLSSLIAGKRLVNTGTHYIRFRAFSAATIIDPYVFFLVRTDASDESDEAESNDTPGTANVILPSAGIAVRRGAIGAAGDFDYYTFNGTAGQRVLFVTDNDPERDAVGTDLVLNLYGADGVTSLLQIDSSVTGSAANPPAEGGNYLMSATGVYYVRVRHFSAAAATGTYHLMVAAQ